MAEITALVISTIEGSQAADDGRHTLIRVTQGADTGHLAIPNTELSKLFELALIEMSKGQTAEPLLSGEKTVSAYQATWYELAKDETGHFVLTITFGAGAKLSFLLPTGMPAQMAETLQVMLGKTAVEAPAKKN